LRTRELGALMTAVAIMPLLYVVLPPGWPGRKLALVAMVCVLTYRPPHPPPGCLDYHVLDVGQGLSVVLRTRQQALLFDTGPSFLNGGDAAELVVLPFLYRFGIDRLDKLVISHGDLDHAGGANSIVAGIEVGEVLVGERIDDLAAAQRECVAGQQWRWDSISFLILHPRMNAPLDRNNSSCVLLLEIGGFRILLTGDIESPAEKLLLHRDLVGATDIVIVPHHGSMTSSSDAFVDRTRPGLAIVSAGFGNQWGLPRPAVVDRWAAAGAAVVNTATSGAVSQRICRHDVPGEVRLERHRALKFWHDVPPAPP
jgi:competence protein ComEC